MRRPIVVHHDVNDVRDQGSGKSSRTACVVFNIGVGSVVHVFRSPSRTRGFIREECRSGLEMARASEEMSTLSRNETWLAGFIRVVAIQGRGWEGVKHITSMYVKHRIDCSACIAG